jgi:hypothetical protein
MTEVSTLRLLHRVAHGLRYRELTELIDRRVMITSLEMVEGALRGLTRGWVAEDARLQHPEYVEGAMVKYGLIDAQFAASNALLEHRTTMVGLEVMRACGFLPRRGERWEADEMACGVGFVEDLAADLAVGECVVKLMLRDGLSAEEHWEPLRAEWNESGSMPKELRIRAGYLPREMKVVDACVTNARSVWFSRHFYL